MLFSHSIQENARVINIFQADWDFLPQPGIKSRGHHLCSICEPHYPWLKCLRSHWKKKADWKYKAVMKNGSVKRSDTDFLFYLPPSPPHLNVHLHVWEGRGKEKLPIKFFICLHPIDIFNMCTESKVLKSQD